MILQMGLIWPMYQVISGGLTNFDPSAYFHLFGAKVIPLTCPNPSNYVNGVLNQALPVMQTRTCSESTSAIRTYLFSVFGFGIGGLALVAALLPALPEPDDDAAHAGRGGSAVRDPAPR